MHILAGVLGGGAVDIAHHLVSQLMHIFHSLANGVLGGGAVD